MPIKTQKRDSIYTTTPIDNLYKPDTSFYYKLDDLTSTDLNGTTTLVTDVMFASNSVNFTPGYINKSTQLVPVNWSIQGWFKFDTLLPVFSIDSDLKLAIVLDRQLNKVSLLYSVLFGDTIVVDKPLSINNSWNFIQVFRTGTTLKLFVNLQLIASWNEFYFPSIEGDLLIGKNAINSNSYSFKAQSILFSKNGDFKDVHSKSLDSYKKYYKAVKAEISPVLYLFGSQSNGEVYPAQDQFTYYSPLDNVYKIAPSLTGTQMSINPRGLALWKEKTSRQHPLEYVLNTSFYLPSKNTSIIVFTSQESITSRSYYLKYNHITNTLQFCYWLQGSGLAQALTISVDLTTYVNIEIIVRNNNFSVYANSVLQSTITGKLVKPVSLAYAFNYNFNGVTNISNYVHLYYFCIRLVDSESTFGGSDIALLPHAIKKNDYVPLEHPFNLHQIDAKPIVPSFSLPFTVTAPSSINTPSNNSLTITQPEYSSDVTYKAYIKTPFYTDNIETSITIPPLPVLLKGTTSISFNVNIGLITKNKKVTYIDLIITNGTYSVTTRINITNTAPYLKNVIQLPGFIEAVLAQDSLQGWVGVNGTTSTSLITSISNGKLYKITNHATRITLSQAISNVRTIFYIYQELNTVNNRLYVGKSDGYTFNGGATGEYIGDLQVNNSSYVKVHALTGVYRKPTVAKNGNFCVFIDEPNQKVKVLQKNGNNWITTPIELNLNLQAPGLINNASIDISENGQHIILGFPEANNGEGVVQIWSKVGVATTWTKTLHLGTSSTASNANSFGHSVTINNDGTGFFASELGTNNIYYYKFNILWSATPTQIITGSSSCVRLSMSSTRASIVFFTGEGRVLTYGTTWTQEATYPDTVLAVVDKATNKYMIFDIDGVLKIFNTNITTPIFTLTNTSIYDLDIYNSDFLLALPLTQQVKIYRNGSYTSPITLNSAIADYGIYSQLTSSTVVISDYDTVLDIFSSDASSYGEPILDVYRNGVQVNDTDKFNNESIGIYCFRTALPMTIDTIGSGLGSSYGANSINGIFLGAIFYDRLLTIQEIQDITYNLSRLLNIQTVRLSDYV